MSQTERDPATDPQAGDVIEIMAGWTRNRDGRKQFRADARREAMGIDWMTNDELAQAIPPAYTEWIGVRLLEFA